MSATQICPTCGAEISLDSPAGLCPKCLLKEGLASQPAAGAKLPQTEASPAASRSGFVPPTPAELSPRFPQLEVLELLGHGGMGAVYKARQPGLDRLVAVKILPPEFSQDPTFIERFQREARALAKLSHPNIVAIYDFGQVSGTVTTRSREELRREWATPLPPNYRETSGSTRLHSETTGYCYFIMEYVDGVNLRQAMRAGALNSAEALKVVPQICDALQFAHDEGIVHRDIKPENILIDKRGRVKIADFGLAKLLGKTAPDVSLTGTQQVMGTLHYMAPEQFAGSRDIDHRADIYSLGVTFYEMLTGELPIGRFAPPSKRVEVDVRLDEVVLRSLEKEPQQRYQHASEIKTAVDQIVCSTGPPPNREVQAQPVSLQGADRTCALIDRTAEGLWLVAALAFFIGVGLLIWLAIVGRLGDWRHDWALYMGIGFSQLFFGAVLVVAGLLLRRRRARLVALILLVIFGVFGPAALTWIVIWDLSHRAALIPFFLGVPLALWTVCLLFREDVQTEFAQSMRPTDAPVRRWWLIPRIATMLAALAGAGITAAPWQSVEVLATPTARMALLEYPGYESGLGLTAGVLFLLVFFLTLGAVQRCRALIPGLTVAAGLMTFGIIVCYGYNPPLVESEKLTNFAQKLRAANSDLPASASNVEVMRAASRTPNPPFWQRIMPAVFLSGALALALVLFGALDWVLLSLAGPRHDAAETPLPTGPAGR